MEINIDKINIPSSLPISTNPLPRFRAKDKNRVVYDDGSFDEVLKEKLGYECGERTLPYLVQDRYNRHKTPQDIKTIIIENAYLKAVFLPGFGGRLYSLYDKVNNQEILYKNPVMQPCNLAILDAWFSGGIEWNIAQLGHTYSTSSDVFFAEVINEDYRFIRMYDYERTRGVTWQIDFHLEDDAKELGVHVKIINDNNTSVPMYWWTNIAVEETKNCRVFSSTKDVVYLNPLSKLYGNNHVFGYDKLPYLPSMPKTDLTYPLNFSYSSEYFFQIPKEEISPYEAIVYESGKLFYERSTQPLRFRKMFCWGNQQGGQNWKDYLALKGQGNYVEIQAGLAPTQLHGLDMEASSVIEFTQIFGVTKIEDPKSVLKDYDIAREIIENKVNKTLSSTVVLDKDIFYKKMANVSNYQTLHEGNGFGMLENIRRTKENKTLLSVNLDFKIREFSAMEKLYLNVLDELNLANLKINENIPSYISDMAYEKYLIKTTANTNKILLACLYYENDFDDKAIKLFKEALNEYFHPLTIRNLARCYVNKNEVDKAIELFETIPFEVLITLDFAYIKEYMDLIGNMKDWDKLFNLYLKLPSNLQEQEAIYLRACEAARYLEKWDFVEKAFNREYANIREGDINITALWLAYAKAKGINESELPKYLDYRMF